MGEKIRNGRMHCGAYSLSYLLPNCRLPGHRRHSSGRDPRYPFSHTAGVTDAQRLVVSCRSRKTISVRSCEARKKVPDTFPRATPRNSTIPDSDSHPRAVLGCQEWEVIRPGAGPTRPELRGCGRWLGRPTEDGPPPRRPGSPPCVGSGRRGLLGSYRMLQVAHGHSFVSGRASRNRQGGTTSMIPLP